MKKAIVRFGSTSDRINGLWVPYNGEKYILDALAASNGAWSGTAVFVSAQCKSHDWLGNPSRLLIHNSKGDFIGCADRAEGGAR